MIEIPALGLYTPWGICATARQDLCYNFFMKFYLIISTPKQQESGLEGLKFYEWLKYLKKSNRLLDYFARQNSPGIVAIFRLNFPSELDDLLKKWQEKVPSDFTVEPLKDPKALEMELTRRLLG